MTNKAIAGSVCSALVSIIALTQAASAAPPDEADSSRNDSGHKVTICHNDHLISVAQSALSAHLDNHDDELVEAIEEEEGCSTTEETPQEEESEQQPPEEEAPAPEDEQKPIAEEVTTGAQSEAQKGETENGIEKVRSCDGKSIGLNKEEKRTLELHNETRKDQGLKPLCVDPTLTKAARLHSKEMAERNYFGHDSPNGETPGERLKRLGYRWAASGENLAWGTERHAEPEDTFERWMKSEGHKKNILEKNFEEVGIGTTTATGEYKGKGERTFYTVDFGNKR